MSLLERLVEFFAAQYRWGLHPVKLVAALAAPALIVYLADRRIRGLVAAVPAEDERAGQAPRIRRG